VDAVADRDGEIVVSGGEAVLQRGGERRRRAWGVDLRRVRDEAARPA
jgi:hypothetical protein